MPGMTRRGLYQKNDPNENEAPMDITHKAMRIQVTVDCPTQESRQDDQGQRQQVESIHRRSPKAGKPIAPQACEARRKEISL